jgi:hypothetical protein
MKRFLYLIVWLAIGAVIGLAAQTWAHIPFWGGFTIALISLFINGIIAEIEDRRPGGFYNPKEPKDRG